ncbi:YggT family protein [uncultured Zhongshania sp.]|jgi:YggT family protein|uniref:YggT family protein n=1 Tax=uncultured Zhongshania sp. TaxID=1642288 RepID=UPI0025D11FDD|nr:YggT family protein [uncultured Zhongshania sp.]|tara:strand:+ start:6280 stop:6867 length:588 start_codon:yes stop_codon:yes gene_type:complete
MSAAAEITTMLLNTVISLAIVAFLLRMILQLVRADFYNPICQFLVKATNPLVIPLRKIIPSVGKIDTASLLLAFIAQALGITLLLQLYGGGFPNPAQLLIWSVIGLCSAVLNLYFFAIIANIIMSWVAQGGAHPAAQILYQITEPVMAPFRKLLPTMGGLDLSPILVFLCINVLEVILRHVAAGVGLHPALIMGL